jgi:hypothetical protein
VDWTAEGARDRHLHTVVNLAGDVFFDLKLKRVVLVDMGGSITVRGAYVSERTRIVKGHGPVMLKTTINAAPLQASADDD